MALTRIKSSNIADETVVAADLADGSITDAKIQTGISSSKLTGNLPAVSGAALTNFTAANVTGALPAIDGSNLTGVATDTSALENNIAILAFKTQSANNLAKFNLIDQVIDEYKDGTGATYTTAGQTGSTATDGYLSTVVQAAFTSDANTRLLLHMEDTGLTDSSSNTHTTTLSGDCARSSAQKKFGSYSMLTTTGGLTMPDHAHFDFGTADFTVEGWVYWNALNTGGSANPIWDTGAWGSNSFDMVIRAQAASVSGGYWEVTGYNGSTNPGKRGPGNDPNPLNTWVHYAVSRTSGVTSMYRDGVKITDHTNDYGSWTDNINWISQGPSIGIGTAGTKKANAYYDEFRVSNVGRYTASFTPNASVGATGTAISTANTALSAPTTGDICMLIENASGTATLNTDLKAYVSRNGGTGWDQATLVDKGSWGTNKKIVSANNVAFSNSASGTDMRYKIEWANQSAGSKETRVHATSLAWA